MKEVLFVRGKNGIDENQMSKDHLYAAKILHKLKILSLFLTGIFAIGFGGFLLYFGVGTLHGIPMHFTASQGISNGQAVLASETQELDQLDRIQFDVPVQLNDTVNLGKGLTVNGDTQLNGNVTIKGKKLDVGLGTITASNVVYGLTAGAGLSTTGGQTPTITNAGVLSFQGQTGAVTLTQGNGMTISGTTISNAGVTSFQGDTGAVTLTAGTNISVSGSTITDTLASNLTTNGIVYANSGSTITALTPGASGYILQSNGTGAAPVWSTALSLGGALTDTILAGANAVLYGAPTTGLFTTATTTTGYQCLLSAAGASGVPSWGTCALGTNFWQENSGILAPKNITDDLAIGGTSTAAAMFQVFGNTGNASTSGNLAFTNAGVIQASTNQDITLGGNTTGNIILSPLNGAGNVGINTTSPTNTLTTNGTLLTLGHGSFGKGSTVNQSDYFGNSLSSILNAQETITGCTPFACDGLTQLTQANPTSSAISNNIYGINNVVGHLPSSTKTLSYNWGEFSQFYNSSAKTDNTSYGIQSRSENRSTGQITNAYGVYGEVENSGNSTGKITNGYGGYFRVEQTGTGTFGTGYGVYIDSANNSGTFTNNYGLYINDQTGIGSTNSYMMYLAPGTGALTTGINKSYIGGLLSIGSNTTPNSKLYVSNNGQTPLGKALVTLDQYENQDIFTASSAGIAKFVINNSGNVGIGTTNPKTLLELSSAQPTARINWTNSTNYGSLQFTQSDNVSGELRMLGGNYGSGRTSNIELVNYNPTAIDFWTNNTERVRIDGSGNLGVNTQSPLAVLDVRGVGTNMLSGTIPVASFSGQTSFATLVANNDGVGDLFTASSSGLSRFVIQNNGNVGIGTTNPSDLLTVSGGNITIQRGSGNYFYNDDNSSVVKALFNGQGDWLGLQANSSNVFSFADKTGNSNTLSTGNILSFKLNGDGTGGNIGIGMTNPNSPLHVVNTSSGATVTSLTLGNGAFANNTGTQLAFNLSNSNVVVSAYIDAVRTNSVVNGATYLSFGTSPGGGTVSEALRLTEAGGAGFQTNAIGNSSLVVNQPNSSGDIFSASQSGNTKFVINHNGNVGITANSGTELNALTLTNTAGQANELISLLFRDSTNTAVSGAIKYKFYSGGNNSELQFFTGLTGSSTEKMVLNNNGNLGIGTTAPSYRLDAIDTQNSTSSASITNLSTSDTASTNVLALSLGDATSGTNSRFIQFFAGANSSNQGIGVGRIQLNNGNVAYNTGGADFAEYFSKGTTPLSQGDIVTIGSDGTATLATQKTGAIGIVSTTAGFIGNAPHDPTQEQQKVVVGLVGQLPVKVSTENGNIQAGDLLTLSSTAGVAMKATKAGEMIGRALESYTNSDSHTIGIIQVLINISYADPNLQLAITNTGDLSVNGQVVGNTQTPTNILTTNSILPSTTQTTNGVTLDQFNGLSTTVSQIQSQIASMSSQLGKIEDLSKQLAELEKTVNLTQALQGISSTSAILGASPLSQDTTIGGNLSVLGQTLLTDVGITGKLTAGLLTIDGMDTSSGMAAVSINTLSGPLKLQSDGIAGLDILNGKITIDQNGSANFTNDVDVKGTVTTTDLTTNTLHVRNTKTIDISDTEAQASGSAGITSIKAIHLFARKENHVR